MKNGEITDYIKNTCKIGQGADCCRFILVSRKGFECGKFGSAKGELDRKVAMGLFTAKGDNCDGYTEEESIKILNK